VREGPSEVPSTLPLADAAIVPTLLTQMIFTMDFTGCRLPSLSSANTTMR
jgi:hypothetical protein